MKFRFSHLSSFFQSLGTQARYFFQSDSRKSVQNARGLSSTLFSRTPQVYGLVLCSRVACLRRVPALPNQSPLLRIENHIFLQEGCQEALWSTFLALQTPSYPACYRPDYRPLSTMYGWMDGLAHSEIHGAWRANRQATPDSTTCDPNKSFADSFNKKIKK